LNHNARNVKCKEKNIPFGILVEFSSELHFRKHTCRNSEVQSPRCDFYVRMGTCISSSISVLPSEYNSTNAPYSLMCNRRYTISPINGVVKQQIKKLRYVRNFISRHGAPSFWARASSLSRLHDHTQTQHIR